MMRKLAFKTYKRWPVHNFSQLMQTKMIKSVRSLELIVLKKIFRKVVHLLKHYLSKDLGRKILQKLINLRMKTIKMYGQPQTVIKVKK